MGRINFINTKVMHFTHTKKKNVVSITIKYDRILILKYRCEMYVWLRFYVQPMTKMKLGGK